MVENRKQDAVSAERGREPALFGASFLVAGESNFGGAVGRLCNFALQEKFSLVVETFLNNCALESEGNAWAMHVPSVMKDINFMLQFSRHQTMSSPTVASNSSDYLQKI